MTELVNLLLHVEHSCAFMCGHLLSSFPDRDPWHRAEEAVWGKDSNGDELP